MLSNVNSKAVPVATRKRGYVESPGGLLIFEYGWDVGVGTHSLSSWLEDSALVWLHA